MKGPPFPPTTTGRLLVGGIWCWAVVGLAVAVLSALSAGGDVPALAWVASVVFPLCAAAAAVALRYGRFRTAGILLVVSAATPTYFAWVVNVPALLYGMALCLLGGWSAGQPGRYQRQRRAGAEGRR